MALIKCPDCSTQVSDKAASCPSCGRPIAINKSSHSPATVTISKSRGVYIILGLLFGLIGFHNFYAGNNIVGAIKIVIPAIAFSLDASTNFYTGFSVIALTITAIWSLAEVIFVKKDSAGNIMS